MLKVFFVKIASQHMKYIQIKQCSECQKGISIDRNEEMLAGNVDADASLT